jgi:subtilisin-like proprotein convertase family protein
MTRCRSWQPKRRGTFLNLALVVAVVAVLLTPFVGPPGTVHAATRTWENTRPIAISDLSSQFQSITTATPYPSTIDVSGVRGTITHVTATINGFSHTYVEDVDILLVAPFQPASDKQGVRLMSDVGGQNVANGVTLTFDDAASLEVPENPPDNTPFRSGTYRPTRGSSAGVNNLSYGNLAPRSFPDPAPPGAYSLHLSDLNGFSPNGTWSLYVINDTGGDHGSISGGWSLTITTTAAPTAADDSATTTDDTPVVIDHLANDGDADGTLDPATVELTSPAAHGSLSVDTNGKVTYTAAAGYGGADSFSYTVKDNDGILSNAATVNLTVNSVNNPPVNTVPGAQTTPGNTPLAFSTATGNAISIADSDAGANKVLLTLEVTSGTLSFGSAADVTLSGDGTGAVTATGTTGKLNSALQHLTFTPASGISGDVRLTVATDDLGNTGAGGPLTAVDSFLITVGALPSVSIGDLSVIEGGIGASNSSAITVSLSASSNLTVTVQIETADGTAQAGQDYYPTQRTVTLPPGRISMLVPLAIIGDTAVESDETFTVHLTGATNATILRADGTVTIRNDDMATPTPTATQTLIASPTPTLTTTSTPSGTQPSAGTPTPTVTPTQAGMAPGTGGQGQGPGQIGATPTPPPVSVSVSRADANRLAVTVTALGTLQQVGWTLTPNIAVEDAAGQPLAGRVISLPPNSNRATFYVRRVSGTSATLPLTLTGSFGTWQTFVGGGPGAW